MPRKNREERRELHKEYMKKYLADPLRYETHKRRVAARNAKLRHESLEYISLLKSKNKCVVCEEDTPCCLDFHHLNPAEKIFEIGCVGRQRPSIQKLKDEIAKCVLICRNCHSKLHSGLIKINKKRASQLSISRQSHLLALKSQTNS